MATYYVATTGNDSNTTVQAQSSSTPWKTIQHAIDTVPTGSEITVAAGTYVEPAYGYLYFNATHNGKTYTIKGEGTYQTYTVTHNGKTFIRRRSGSGVKIVTPSNYYTVRFYNGMATGSVTFDNIEFVPAGGSYGEFYGIFSIIANSGTASSVNLTVKNCTITPYVGMTYMLKVDNSTTPNTTRQIEFDHCEITRGYHIFYMQEGNELYVHDCQITNGGDSKIFFTNPSSAANYSLTNVYVDDNIIDAPNYHCMSTWYRSGETLYHTAISQLRMRGNSIKCGGYGLSVFEAIDNLVLEDNIVIAKCMLADLASGAEPNFELGYYNSPIPTTYPIKRAIVRNNVLGRDPASDDNECHSLQINQQIVGADISGNTLHGSTTYQLQVSGSYNRVHRNVITGGRGISFAGGSQNLVDHNSLAVTGTYGITWTNITVSDSSTITPDNNIFENNIVVGGSNTTLLYDNNGNSRNIKINNNCYYGGVHLAYLGGVNYDTLSTLKAKWSTYSTCFTDNDDESIVENPQFDSQYHVHNPYFWDKDFGAWQPTIPINSIVGGSRARRVYIAGVPLSEIGL